MAVPPPWDKAIYARRHLIENRFSSLKDWARIALRRDKTRRSWMGFAHLAAAILNLRIAKSGHRPFCNGPSVVNPHEHWFSRRCLASVRGRRVAAT
jgi:hypothetical protein